MNKDRAIFYLKRRLREVEDSTTTKTMEQMAADGVGYGTRLKIIETAEHRADAVRGEIEALTEAIEFIERNA